MNQDSYCEVDVVCVFRPGEAGYEKPTFGRLHFVKTKCLLNWGSCSPVCIQYVEGGRAYKDFTMVHTHLGPLVLDMPYEVVKGHLLAASHTDTARNNLLDAHYKLSIEHHKKVNELLQAVLEKL